MSQQPGDKRTARKILAWIVALIVTGGVLNLLDFWERVAVPVWRHFVPHYEVKIDPQGAPVNQDEDLVIKVKISKNGEPSGAGLTCTWTVDGRKLVFMRVEGEEAFKMEGPGCVELSLSPWSNNNLDKSKDDHTITVTEMIFDGGDAVHPSATITSEPAKFLVRRFKTPEIEVSSSELYVREKARVAFKVGDVPSETIRACRWRVTAGSVSSVSENGCVASYQAPDRLSDPPNNLAVTISGEADIGNWSSVQSKTQSITVFAPEEMIYQYVVDASQWMTKEAKRRTLFDTARSRIIRDLSQLTAAKGYLGIRVFGDVQSNDQPQTSMDLGCKRTNPIVPLDAIDAESARRRILAVKPGGYDAPLLLAWRSSLDDYARLKAARRLTDPRYFLVTLASGGDNCEKIDPIEQLVRLGINVSDARLQEDWQKQQLIVFTIATSDLARWKNTWRSAAYEGSNGILILGDNVSVVDESLRAISMLGSHGVADVRQACFMLERILTAQGNGLGTVKLSKICDSLVAAKK